MRGCYSARRPDTQYHPHRYPPPTHTPTPHTPHTCACTVVVADARKARATHLDLLPMGWLFEIMAQFVQLYSKFHSEVGLLRHGSLMLISPAPGSFCVRVLAGKWTVVVGVLSMSCACNEGDVGILL